MACPHEDEGNDEYRSSLSEMAWAELRGFQNDAFNDIGDVFALVHGGFNDFKNFFPLDDLHGVFFFVEELRDQGAAKAVAVVFVAIDFDAMLQGLIGRFDGVDRRGDFNRGRDQDLDQVDGAFANFVDTIEDKTAGGSVDEVDDVVKLAGKRMDVFAVERGDESLIELGEDSVGDFVALMLDGLDGLYLFGDAGVMRKHLLKRFGADHDIFSLLGEQVEETLFAR